MCLFAENLMPNNRNISRISDKQASFAFCEWAFIHVFSNSGKKGMDSPTPHPGNETLVCFVFDCLREVRGQEQTFSPPGSLAV